MGKVTKILSIDGGGIRGIIPALLLAEIEKRTGKPVAELFDLISGTSTGGILALALTKPGEDGKPEHSAAKLVKLYEDEGSKIFSRSVWHRVRAIGNVAEERYPAAGLEKVLDKYFGETRLQDAIKPVLITSYEIEQRFPFFFRSERAKSKSNYDFPMKKVARATSAAPTYFEPIQIATDEEVNYYALVDGGVFANNPGMCAYVEGVTTNPDANDYLVVSLGTGELTRPILYDDARRWGLIGWAQPLLNVIFAGVTDTVDYQLRQLLSDKPDRTGGYFRFQVRLTEGNDDMDDAGRTNLRVLKLLAENLIKSKKEQLDRLCDKLSD